MFQSIMLVSSGKAYIEHELVCLDDDTSDLLGHDLGLKDRDNG